ncbi:MAG: hypothetical protein LBV69_01180 [Bacteroidales bacterium]|nr:hypothetical protein [Bacteroidales bacterium]
MLLHFDIVSIKESGDASQAQGVLHILLEEKNILPSVYDATDYESKGFYESSEIQDFPIRGKKVLLKLRRRRWRDKATKRKEIRNDFSFILKGCKITQELAIFLKKN